MFTKRHFEWLANFAKQHLSPAQIVELSIALHAQSPKFDERLFLAKSGWVTKLDSHARKALEEAKNGN